MRPAATDRLAGSTWERAALRRMRLRSAYLQRLQPRQPGLAVLVLDNDEGSTIFIESDRPDSGHVGGESAGLDGDGDGGGREAGHGLLEASV